MAPELGRQLLHPLDLQAFQSGVLPVNILDFKLTQDTVVCRASPGSDPECHTLGLAPQGQGAGLQGKFDIAATIGLGLDLQDS